MPASTPVTPSGSGVVHPERAHHALPVQGSLTRYLVRYLDPSGSVQHLAMTSTWSPQAVPGQDCFWVLLLRGIEQADCKVLEVRHLTEKTIEMEVPRPRALELEGGQG